MSKTPDNLIVGIGEVLWDILPDGEKLGGAPANFAYSIIQFGLPGMVVSAVGDDELGRRTVHVLENYGVKSLMARVPFPTGQVDVSIDDRGVPCYDIREPAAWDFIPAGARLADIASKTKVACFGTLAQRCDVSRAAINLFLDTMPDGPDTLKVFDINLRQSYYSREVVVDSLMRANILKANNEELVSISRMLGYPGLHLEDTCKSLMNDYSLRCVALTCGENGSYIFTPEAVSFIPTPPIVVADTVGAGDSFTAAFVAGLLRGKSIQESHQLAVDVSAFVCSCKGAMAGYPANLLTRF